MSWKKRRVSQRRRFYWKVNPSQKALFRRSKIDCISDWLSCLLNSQRLIEILPWSIDSYTRDWCRSRFKSSIQSSRSIDVISCSNALLKIAYSVRRFTETLILSWRSVRVGRESRTFFLFLIFITFIRCNICRERVYASALSFLWSQPHHFKHSKIVTSKSLFLSTEIHLYSDRELLFLILSDTIIRWLSPSCVVLLFLT